MVSFSPEDWYEVALELLLPNTRTECDLTRISLQV